VAVVLTDGVVFVPMLQELLFEVRDVVRECVPWSKEPFVRGHFLQHLMPVFSGLCNLDGWQSAQCSLNRVLGFALVIKFDPLWVPPEGGIIDRSEQFGHADAELLGLAVILATLAREMGGLSQCQRCYNSALPTSMVGKAVN